MEYGQLVMDHLTKETALIIASWSDLSSDFTGVVNFGGHYLWIFRGLIHREDGPAISYVYEGKRWYLYGKSYSQVEWFELLTPEQQEKVVWNMDNW